MNRNLLLGLLATVVIAALCPAVGHSQPPPKAARIGYLSALFPASINSANIRELRQSLRELGYIEHQNSSIEWRFARGKLNQLQPLAADLVSIKVDVILAQGNPAARAAKRTTTSVPIVALSITNPVESGLVASLARPGANVTGFTNFSQELSEKRLELIKDIIPQASHIGILHAAKGNDDAFDAMAIVASALRVKLLPIRVLDAMQIHHAFITMTKVRVDAFVVQPFSALLTHRRQVLELSAKHKIPGMYPWASWVASGGLASYAAADIEQYRHAAIYVNRILKGTKPADLPVQQPTKFELVINLKTAKETGVAIPPNVLARTDNVLK